MPLRGTLKQAFHYCGTGARYGGMVLVTGFPLVGLAMPENHQTAAVFPPLGGMNHLLEPVASLLILASGILAANLRKRRSPSAKFRRGFFVAAVGVALYVIFVLFFVVRIDFPDHTYQYRSVGFRRTELGRYDPDLKNAPAAHAVKVVGTEEEAIETVWEPWSIDVARFLLFASYVLMLGSLNFAFGAVKFDATKLNV
jgi:hypothetical protein